MIDFVHVDVRSQRSHSASVRPPCFARAGSGRDYNGAFQGHMKRVDLVRFLHFMSIVVLALLSSKEGSSQR